MFPCEAVHSRFRLRWGFRPSWCVRCGGIALQRNVVGLINHFGLQILLYY